MPLNRRYPKNYSELLELVTDMARLLEIHFYDEGIPTLDSIGAPLKMGGV